MGKDFFFHRGSIPLISDVNLGGKTDWVTVRHWLIRQVDSGENSWEDLAVGSEIFWPGPSRIKCGCETWDWLQLGLLLNPQLEPIWPSLTHPENQLAN